MRLSLLLALALATATTSASAQNTWWNLHFGESRDAVSAQMASQNMPVGTSPDNALQTNTDYELPLPGLSHTFPMAVSFQFDDNSELSRISLALDLPAMRRYWAAIGPDEALYNFATEQLTGALTGRYGAPLYITACTPDEEKSPAGCTLIWRAEGPTTIKLERVPSAHGPQLRVLYLPLETAL